MSFRGTGLSNTADDVCDVSQTQAACLNCYNCGQTTVEDAYVGVEKFVSRLYNAHDGV